MIPNTERETSAEHKTVPERPSLWSILLTLGTHLSIILAAVVTAVGVAGSLGGEEGPGIGSTIAKLFGVAAGVGLFVIWERILRMAPKDFHDPRKWSAVAGFGLLLAVVTVGLNSVFIAAQIGGKEAVRVHLGKDLDVRGQDVTAKFQDLIGAETILPHVLSQQERLADLAEAEERSGILSGVRGSGSVQQALAHGATSLQHIYAEADKKMKSIGRAKSRAGNMLGEMLAVVADETSSVEQQQVEYVRKLQDLEGLWLDAERNDPLNTLDAISVGTTVRSIRNPRLSRGQRESLERLGDGLEKFEAWVRERVSEERLDRENKEFSIFLPLDPRSLVLRYRDEVAWAWIAALFVDLLPALMLGLMALTAFVCAPPTAAGGSPGGAVRPPFPEVPANGARVASPGVASGPDASPVASSPRSSVTA